MSTSIFIWSNLLYQLGEGTPRQATGVKKGENNYRTAALTWKIARISPFQSHYKWDLIIYSKTYLQKVLARLQDVHEIFSINADIWIEHVEPFSEVLFHGVKILVGSAETAQLSLLDELQGELLVPGHVN